MLIENSDSLLNGRFQWEQSSIFAGFILHQFFMGFLKVFAKEIEVCGRKFLVSTWETGPERQTRVRNSYKILIFAEKIDNIFNNDKEIEYKFGVAKNCPKTLSISHNINKIFGLHKHTWIV